jgi:endonuclease YncB( thermonuclease family)
MTRKTKTKTPVAADSRENLIALIRRELRDGMEAVAAAVQRQRVLTYWQIGRHIHEYTAANPSSAADDIKRIAEGIGYNVDVVRKMRKFYRCFPSRPSQSPLSWSQYRALLSAPEADRQRWYSRAAHDKLGEGELYQLINGERRLSEKESMAASDAAPGGVPVLAVTRGRLYVYKTLQAERFDLAKGSIMVDCGFEIRHMIVLGPKSTLKGGHLVVSVKSPEGYRLKYAYEKPEHLYTYKACLDRVVDGDTILLTVDAGFDIWLDLRARLRGIDAPELSTAAGYRARQFVAGRLSGRKSIVVKTYRTDKYGRYLVDIFYLPEGSDPRDTADKGVFLNQELLDEGLAKPYK